MTTIYKRPLSVLHDQRRPSVRCIGCGAEGHAVKDCPDETEGRRIARGRANTLANFDLNRTRARLLSSQNGTENDRP